MNAAFIITRADVVGGATVHVRDLALGMLNRGHQVVVLIGGTGPAVDELVRARIPFRSLRWLGRPIHPVKDVLAVFELQRVLRELRPDMVCTHTAKAGLVGRLAAHRVGIPAFYTPHGWPITDRISKFAGRVFTIAERTVAPMSAAIINVCEAERALAQRYRIAADSKLAVIHNGVVDVDPHFHAQPGTSPVRLIMVARFEVQKDHATLLHALATLQELDWSLELVGDGPTMPAAHALTAYLGLSSRVHFAGSDDNVAARLATAQVFVLSSVFEGFPLSTLEAMRAGLPVVASDVGGVREAVVDGQTGAVVPPRNPAALAAALRPLILNPSLRVQQGRAGRQVYESNFTFEQMLEKTLSVYDSALPVGATEVSLQQTRNGHVDPEHVQTKPLKESARGL